MTIEITNESGVDIDETVLLRLTENNLAELHVSPDADVAILLVDEGAMEALHVQWMDEPGPTDVLSFPMDELRPGTQEQPTPPGLLGDIVLCPQVAETQAQAAGHTTVDELILLTTHGLLHLLGFDHAEPEEEREMFGLQRDLIAAFHVSSVDDAHDRDPPAHRGGPPGRARRSDGGAGRGAGRHLARRPRRDGDVRTQRDALSADRRRSRSARQRRRVHQDPRRDDGGRRRDGGLHDRVRQHLVGHARRRGADDRGVVRPGRREPRAVGRQHARGLLQACAPLVRGARIVLGPLAHLLVLVGNRVTPGIHRGASFASEEQLLSMVDEAASQDLIEEDDRELIHSVFEFTDTYVREVMVPRTDMVTMDAAATTQQAMQLFLDKGVSRVPVADGEADDITGVVYLKDLVQFAFRDETAWRDAPVAQIARPAVFVPDR
jgi:rRNA maturation RNase YbeY